MNCPLCRCENISDFFESSYFSCGDCGLIFMDMDQHLSLEAEKKRYELHENHVEDSSYIKYLSRLLQHLPQGMLGEKIEGKQVLDYGCGPEKGYEYILGKRGAKVESYDPFYHKNEKYFHSIYDLILVSEAAEHFCTPKNEFEKLRPLLKKNGVLAIRTELYNDSVVFKTWYYRKDLSHVVFYTEKTISYLAKTYDLSVLYLKSPFVIFKANT